MSDDNTPIDLDDERRKRREILESKGLEGIKKKWENDDREALDKAIARHAPPVFVEPRCAICSGPYAQHRVWIEQQLIKGRSHSAIARAIPPIDGKALDRRTVGTHKDKHMKLEEAVIRGVLEEEATLIGQNFEEGVKGAVTERGIVKVLIQKAYEDALNNITTVEPKDLIQLIKLSTEFEAKNADLQYQEAGNAVRIFMEAIKNVMLGGQFVDKEIGNKILIAIQDEVRDLRQKDEIESALELRLGLSIPDAEIIDDDDEPTLPNIR
jgi:hypothetical protein